MCWMCRPSLLPPAAAESFGGVSSIGERRQVKEMVACCAVLYGLCVCVVGGVQHATSGGVSFSLWCVDVIAWCMGLSVIS